MTSLPCPHCGRPVQLRRSDSALARSVLQCPACGGYAYFPLGTRILSVLVMTATIGLLVFLGRRFEIWNPETPQEFLLVIVVFLGSPSWVGKPGRWSPAGSQRGWSSEVLARPWLEVEAGQRRSDQAGFAGGRGKRAGVSVYMDGSQVGEEALAAAPASLQPRGVRPAGRWAVVDGPPTPAFRGDACLIDGEGNCGQWTPTGTECRSSDRGCKTVGPNPTGQSRPLPLDQRVHPIRDAPTNPVCFLLRLRGPMSLPSQGMIR
jgi:hypothetical protein